MRSTESPIGASRMEAAATGCLRRYLTRYAGDPAPWLRYDVRRSDAGHVDGRYDLITEAEHPRPVPPEGVLPVDVRDHGSEATRWGSLVHKLLELHGQFATGSPVDVGGAMDLAFEPGVDLALAFIAAAQASDPLGRAGLRIVGGLEDVLWMPAPVHCQRLDALAVDHARGRLWAVDYKTTGPWAPKTDWRRSFQMAGFDALGRANFGARWGGVVVVELVADDKRQFVRTRVHMLREFGAVAFTAAVRAGQRRVEAALDDLAAGRVEAPAQVPGVYGDDCVSWGRPCPATEMCHTTWGV